MHVEAESRTNWGRRAFWAGVVVALVLLGGLIASATVPRWWAQRVGDQANGSITQGTLLGLFYGFVFTLLPIAALALILRWRTTWRWVVFALAVAVILALPNLMTLGIVLGRGNAAHAGDRILDVEAPAFRGGTFAGTLLACALVGFVLYLLISRGRARSDEQRAREERDSAPAPP
ncbi:MAG: hypothetical protein K0S64_578 [Gaiellaceae bacterium]|jgi:hypothetical protein|nr:hypothetical protein [Gaiellaceae bacterium]